MYTNTKEAPTPWFSSTDWKEAPTPWSSLAPTRRKHQLPKVLWHQPEGGSNPLWAPTHNLLTPSCRPDIFSGTNLKETMIPYGKSPNYHKYKSGSKLQPLLKLHQTTNSITANHCQNHCWSLHCAKLCHNSIWSHLTKPLLGFPQKLLGFLHII